MRMFLLSLPPTTDTPEPPRLYAHAQCVLSSPLACLLAGSVFRPSVRACRSKFFFSSFLAKEGTRADADAQARTHDMRRATHRKQKSVVLQNHAITRTHTKRRSKGEQMQARVQQAQIDDTKQALQTPTKCREKSHSPFMHMPDMDDGMTTRRRRIRRHDPDNA